MIRMQACIGRVRKCIVGDGELGCVLLRTYGLINLMSVKKDGGDNGRMGTWEVWAIWDERRIALAEPNWVGCGDDVVMVRRCE